LRTAGRILIKSKIFFIKIKQNKDATN
jgi:hypothetical protein